MTGRKLRISVALWLWLTVLIRVTNCQSKCERTNRLADTNCQAECTLSAGCVNSNEECRCDGDCGYSCVPKGLTCSSKPHSIPNTIVQYTGEGLGDTITYTCKDGYTLSGMSKRTCRGNGNWDGIGPTCLRMCKVPDIPFSVYIKEPKDYEKLYKTGERITIACKEGYRASGNPVIICIGGAWTRFPFECEATDPCKRTVRAARTKCTEECAPASGCADQENYICVCDGQCGNSCVEKGMSCGDPPDVTDGHREFNSTLYNSTVRYTCNDGFGFNSKNHVKRCTAKKTWEGLKPRCLPDCKRPAPPGNGFILNPKDSYTSGEKVTFECKTGYNKHGMATQMCFRGKWTILPFKCVEGGCGDPGPITNGQRLGDNFIQKDRVFFNCNLGYKLHGPVSVTCLDNGTWSAPNPTCDVVHCTMLTPPTNGSMSSNDTVFQSKISFTCESGFDLIGVKTTICQTNGQWSSKTPICQAVSCEKPRPPSNGSMVASSITFTSIIRFACDEGFVLSGSSSRKCQANRTWSGTEPRCLAVDCGSLPTPLNGTKQGNLTTFPNEVQFKCQVGFELLGSSVRHCQANRTWSGKTAVCKAVDCGRLTKPLNGNMYGNLTTFPNKVRFTCNSGFDLLGSSVRECQANRTWNGFQTVCKAVDCGPLSSPRNGSKHGSATTFPNKIQFLCDTGFKLLGSSIRECQANRTWSGMNTVCKAVDCGSVPTPLNGTKQGNLTTFPNEVHFKCHVGFDLLGSSVRHCQANRTWSGETTVCKAIDCGKLTKPLNGSMYGDLTTFPNKVQFRCHSGFDLLGSSVRECQANRTWSGVETVCKAVDCGLLTSPRNGSRHGNLTTFPNKVQFLCDIGFNLLGSSVRVCQANRTWSGMHTLCNAVDCGSLLNPMNGTKEGNLTTFPNEVHFKCHVGFDLLGSSFRQCQANRTWSGETTVCKAVDCGRLVTPLNGSMYGDLTTFPNKVQFQCHSGFELLGSSARECQANRTWSGVETVCKAVDCGPLYAPHNGSKHGNSTTFPNKIQFLCDIGFKLLGSSVRDCQANRTWSGMNTVCKAVDCGRLPTPLNGTKQRYLTTFPNEVQFRCHVGFELLGSFVRQCQANRTWSGKTAVCKAVDCGRITKPLNGSMYGDLTTFPNKVQFRCHSGFDLLGSSVRECQANRTWNGVQTVCKAVDCGPLYAPHNGSKHGNSTTFPNKIQFLCDIGFNLLGSSVRDCQANRTWSGMNTVCKAVDCGRLPTPLNGTKQGNLTTFPNEVQFRCHVGFELLGSFVRQCQANRTWSGKTAVCKAVDCGRITKPLNGSMYGDLTTFPNKVQFRCHSGFDLLGSSVRECQANRTWNGVQTVCKAVDCGPLSSPRNGSKHGSATTFPNKIQFLCDTGFKLLGSSIRECQANRTWSGMNTVCKAVDCGSVPTPLNGTKQGSLTTFPNEVHFKCHVGFDLLGSSVRHCQANRTWSGETTVCKAIDCGKLTKPLNGSMYGDLTTFPNKVQFRCHSGFDLLGSSVRECQANRTWSGVETVCKAVDCGLLTSPRNGSRHGNSTTFPNKVQFLCDIGFNLLGSSVRECQANRTWSGMHTVCNAVDCGSLPTPLNGTKQGSLATFPNEVHFKCHVGFELLGSSVRQCQANRTWSGKTTVCKAVDCGRLVTPLNGSMYGNFTTFPNNVQFQCHSGFELLGSSVRECQANRTWSGFQTVCKAVNCGPLSIPRNGSRHGNETTFPNKIQFLCDVGFNLLGSSVRDCQANRTWSGMNTVCKAVDCGSLPTPLNGTKQGNLTTFPNKVQFKCHVGFELLGSSVRQCQANRTWSGKTAVCKAVDCGRITKPLNGSMYGDLTTFPNKVQFRCHSGFDLLGSSVRECQANRTWNGVQTVCKAVDCGPLYAPHNGSKHGNSTTFPNKIQFLCDIGFKLLGSSVRDCQANRTWSGMNTVCKAVDCESLPTPLNGTKQGNLTTFPNEVHFKCHVGFDLLGSSVRQCQANRTWSGETTVCKAVDCGKLSTPLNGSMYGNLTTFPNKVQFRCHSGFDLLGSSVRECQANSTWNELQTICKAVDCGPLYAPHNGSKHGNSTTFPNKIHFLCDIGFKLLGSSVRDCQANRTWSGMNTVCKAVHCGSLPTPLNGTKQGNFTTFPNEVHFKCHVGFELLGSFVRQCQANRTWSGETTVCKAVDCGRITKPLNGSMYGDLTTFPNKVQFRCHSGFDLLGSSVRECQANRTWSGVEIVCKAVDCGLLYAPHNGSKQGNSTTFPNKIQFLCDIGFNLLGSSVRECQASRTWSGMNTVCKAVDCGILPTPLNGTKQGNLTTFPNEVHFKCHAGFELLGSSIRQCQANRTWSGENSLCKAVDCGRLTKPLNGSMYGDLTTFPNKVQFQCKSGFDLLGSSVRECQANRTWSGVKTECKAVDCGLLNTPRNGSSQGNITTFPNKVQFFCDFGFILLGSSVRKCQANRTWSGMNTVCKAVDCGNLSTPMNGTKNGDLTTFPNKVKFWCDVGFNFMGSSTRECLANGTWSGEAAYCKAADCGPLEAPRNGSKKGEQTTFPNVVELFCDEGFLLSGSETRTCLPNGTWNGTQTSCSAIDCGTLLPPSNGSMSGKETTYPSFVTFSCDEGFDMRGSAFRQCRSNGTWSGRDTTCEAVNCGPLTVPRNGSKEGLATDFPNTVMFHCDAGFTLSGSSVRVCQSNGTWSGMSANCSAIDCGPLPVPLNGSSSGLLTVFPNKIGFTCDEGFLLRGPSVRMCQENGTWSENETYCDVVNCGELPVLRNGSIEGTRTTFPNTLSFACDSGFLLNGSSSRSCQPSGSWSGEEAACEAVDCGPLRVPANGTLQGPMTVFPNKIIANCDDGFELTGSSVRYCQANGNWSGNTTRCQAVDCGSLSVPTNGSLYGRLTTFPNSLSFACDDGFRLRGSEIRACQANGTWTGNNTTCEAVDCGVLSVPVNASSFGSLTVFPNQIRFKCDEGFDLRGSSIRSCEANGTWSGNDTTCAAVDCGALDVPKNGSLVQNQTTYPNSAYLQCDDGFLLKGSSVRVCQSNRTWSGTDTICEAVDCHLPPVPSNGSAHGTLTVFPNEFRFECNHGFELKGATVRRCEASGSWSGNETKCEVQNCGLFVAPRNGFVVGSETTYLSTIEIKCHYGFVLFGPASRICQANGTWTGQNTTCEIVDCGLPPTSTGVKADGNLTTYPNKILYSCDIGLTLNGSIERMCQQNGTWSGVAGHCQVVDCGKLIHPEHGWIYGEETTYLDKVIYTCGIGYQLRGPSERKCLTNGSWSGSEPFCKEKRCGPPNKLPQEKAYLTQKPKERYSSGEKVYYGCKAGSVLRGRPTQQCSNGKWTKATFLCRPLSVPTCKSPDLPDYAYISNQRGKGRYLNGDELYFECDGGYALDGVPVIKCTDGQWSPFKFNCKAVDCGPLGSPVNGRISDTTGTTYGHSYTFSCDQTKGLVLNGSAVRRCLENERWSGTQPVCKLQDCGDPGHPAHGRQLQSQYTFDEVVTFQCDSGYARRGWQKVKCQINGMWTRPTPTCIDCSLPLGLQSRKLPDNKISASSERDSKHGAHHARLHGNSAWCSARSAHDKFLQIDFPQTTEIFAVATQGHPKEYQWLYKYKLKYSLGNQWLTYKESGKEKVFIGNTDRNSVVKNHLKEPPIAKRLKIERHTDPDDFVGSVLCFRAEVYGCEFQSDCITIGTKVLAKWYSHEGKTFYFHGFVTDVRPNSVQVSPSGNHVALENLREISRHQPDDILLDKRSRNINLDNGSRVVVHSKNVAVPSTGLITNRYNNWYEIQLDGGEKLYEPLKNIRLMAAPSYCEEI